MGRYLFHRTWQSLVTLALASVVVFLGVRALPGDPALALAGEEATPEQLAAVRADLGLDQSLPVQYGRYVGNLLRGDLGESVRTGQPVADLVATTLPVTAWLSLYAMVVAVVLGVGAGVVAAVRRGRWQEWAVSSTSVLLLSVPSFWIGILAVLVLAVWLGIFPASGYVSPLEDPLRALWHLTMPAFVLGTAISAVVMRQTRASMLETLSADYVRTARAKGLSPRRVLGRYALRNSLVVVVTVIGLQLGGLISGAVVTERIFGLPGLGRLTLDAVFTRDYAVIQAVVVLVTAFYVVINLAVDALYSLLDPRVRVEA